MESRYNRRDFLAVAAAAGAGLAVGPLRAASARTALRKARIGGAIDEQTLRAWKAAGFDGVETTAWNVSARVAAARRETATSLGMKIHSVLFGWGNLNGGGTALTEGVTQMETALQAARGYGADAVLYVPCSIGGMPMPEAWEFDIRFDEKTGHLRQVVAGDNAKYRKYIEAHDRAVDASREGVRRLIPTAEKTGVVVALENVWNNLWVKPDLFAHFVASFNSPWVRAYFDIGNHVKYAPSQEWIRALGRRIVKCHVKDFRLGPDGRGGDFCDICDGSVDWPAVRKALDAVGYDGWMTTEGGDLSPGEESKRLDRIFAGQ